jgi:hypothetical protein
MRITDCFKVHYVFCEVYVEQIKLVTRGALQEEVGLLVGDGADIVAGDPLF